MTMNFASRWQTFRAAPHRMMFFGGVTQSLLAIAWWLSELLSRYAGFFPAPAITVPPYAAHAFLMIYGFFPFFIFGFLMTAAPNWVNGAKVEARFYVPAFLLMAAGIGLFYVGLYSGNDWLIGAVALYLAGMLTGWFALFKIVMESPHADKRHAYVVILVFLVGGLGAAAYLVWLASDQPLFLTLAISGGLWFFLLPIFVSVTHRMLPFFSSTALRDYPLHRPYWALFALLAGMYAHGVMEIAGAASWLWVVDLPMMAVAFHLSWRWGFHRCFEVRLVAVLHIAFLWLGIALALYSLQSLARLTGYAVLGMAPLHALAIGYFSSMAIAMVTRVTLGHAGRPLVADGYTWALFLGFQGTAITRIAGDLPFVPTADAVHFYLLAACLWLVSFLLWARKYLPIYLRPRVDGRPG